MTKKKSSVSRRNFLKTAGAVGVGSLLSPLNSISDAQTKPFSEESQFQVVPTRSFGKTGVDVPILCLGSAFGRSSDLLLKQSLKMGVRLWDTAAVYGGGNAERAIGKYFARFPEDRKKVLLLTKSLSLNADMWSNDLDDSLERMSTSYIDIYLIHSVEDADDLASPLADPKLWADKRKSEGKIRFFGFSTHRDMEENLMKAAKSGWVDGVMFNYNFRIMHFEKMKKAVDLCSKAGIGLIAMKTQAPGYSRYTVEVTPNNKEQAFFNQLAKKGLTFEQAKLKAVWDDHRIASITSGITNMTTLQANVDAAVNTKKLSLRDKQFMNQYARQTASNYCAGCASICGSQINNEVPISDVMRFLMYARCYGEIENAKSYFNKLPLKVRKRMTHIDYMKAEQKCPQQMEIGRLMRVATTELA